MIKYEWRTELSRAEAEELADLLDRAARYDAEPEYSTIEFADVTASMATPDSPDRHLLIWMLPHATALSEPDTPERIAGLLRLTGAATGAARAVVVIDPELRSIGIMTLLAESVGLSTTTPGGWLGTGAHVITAWARGNHPAAGRLSNRFLIPRTRRVWKLIRSTQPSPDSAAAPVLEPITAGAVDELSWCPEPSGQVDHVALREGGRITAVAALQFDPVRSDEFGVCATVAAAAASPSSDPDQLRRLLDGAAVLAHEAGMTGLILFADSDDMGLVHAARLAGFQHDRTDVRFQLGTADGH